MRSRDDILSRRAAATALGAALSLLSASCGPIVPQGSPPVPEPPTAEPPAPPPAAEPPAPAPASPLRIAWALGFCHLAGRSQIAFVNTIALDPRGDAVLGGQECASPDVDCSEVFVAKVTPSGKASWFKKLRARGIRSIDIAPSSGEILVGGSVNGAGDQKPFVAKLDGLGNVLWERHWTKPGGGWHSPASARFGEGGGALAVLGWHRSSPAKTSEPMRWSVDRLSAAGAPRGAVDLPSGDHDAALFDAAGIVLATLVPANGQPGARRGVSLGRFDASGRRVGSREIAIPMAAGGLELARDPWGNLFAVAPSGDQRGVVILKLDASGDELWRREYRSSELVYGPLFIAVDPRGYLLVGGTFSEAITFERALSSPASHAVFLARLDAAGEVRSERLEGVRGAQLGDARLGALRAGPNGRIVIAGAIEGIAGAEQGSTCPPLVAEIAWPD